MSNLLYSGSCRSRSGSSRSKIWRVMVQPLFCSCWHYGLTLQLKREKVLNRTLYNSLTGSQLHCTDVAVTPWVGLLDNS